jgi:hypothetical protein
MGRTEVSGNGSGPNSGPASSNCRVPKAPSTAQVWRPGVPKPSLRTLRDVATVTVPLYVGRGTLLRVSERIREVLGEVDHPCHSCGYGCAVAVETRPVKRFRDRFRNDPDRRVRRFETCLDCGATVRVRPEKPGGVGGGNGRGPGYLAQ